MTEDEYIREDAVGLAALVRRRAVTSVQLVEHALTRIAALNAGLGAVVALDGEAALARAAAVSHDLPLAGVPVLVKDTNVDVAGFATRHGSRLYADAPIADADSILVTRLRAAGAVILGRTKTPEFCERLRDRAALRWSGAQPLEPKTGNRGIERRVGGRILSLCAL
jgi:amidase